MMKCICIGASLWIVRQYSKGRTHYLKYLSKGLQGSLFGLAYSFYFLARKVENEQANSLIKEMGLQNPFGTTKKDTQINMQE